MKYQTNLHIHIPPALLQKFDLEMEAVAWKWLSSIYTFSTCKKSIAAV